MTGTDQHDRTSVLAAAAAHIRLWIWGVLVMSIAAFSALAWINLRDEAARAKALAVVRDFREARIDLAQGLLHVSLGGGQEAPFDRSQGIALLQQALASLDRAVVAAALPQEEATRLRTTIADLGAFMVDWTTTSGQGPRATTRLRIAFSELDRMAESIDSQLRREFRAMSDDHAAAFRIALGVAAVLVIAMCAMLLVISGAHERSLAEKRRGERELRRWTDAFEHAGIGIAISEPGTSTIQFANTAYAKMRGMTVAEVCGCGIEDLYTPEEAEKVRRMVPICDREGQLSYESRYRHKNGTDFPVLVHVISVRDEQGQVRYRVSTPIDITDLKRTQRELAEAQKMEAIGQLTGGVAHDFNNMLTVISGTIDILADGVADRPQLATIARLIDQAAQRGADLTRQLLAFARRQPLEPRETDVNALIGETARLLRPTLGAQVAIRMALDGEVWPAMIDPSQLSNALINLAVNARDAMPGGGSLTLETTNVVLSENTVCGCGVSVAKPGPYVMITVRDTGTGIPDDIRDKVFQPFFTTKEAGKGTGLGLSMVYGFIKQSGGHIELETAAGKGTAIKLYLPKGEAPARQTEVKPGTSPGGSETILVVEDDDMVRKYVVTQLHSLGYRTLTAVDGPSALALVDAGTPFDLLFTDVVMPGMNGGELAEAVLRRRPGTPVLYTSGFTENAELDSALLADGVQMLAKPYRKGDLARKLREVLGPEPTALAV
jgi:PAS domain S-box-containing protein